MFQCVHTNKYTAVVRRAFSPFATAGKIKLISFDPTRLPDPPDSEDGKRIRRKAKKPDPVDVITPMAPNRFVLNYRKVNKETTLNAADIDRLTDILFNVGYTPLEGLKFENSTVSGCYNPRNAIVFFDAKGNVTQYIELCFQCEGHYFSSSKIMHIEFCEQKYELLAKFFGEKSVI